jgi:hypothetical protein
MESVNKIEVKYTYILATPDGDVEMEFGSTGTGTVVAVDVDDESSLVLTAGHVCDVEQEMMSPFGMLKLSESSMSIITFRGTRLEAFPLVSSMSPDVCVLYVKGIAGPIVEIATELPPLGSAVMNAACPLGFKGDKTLHVSTGLYEGVLVEEVNKYVMSSVPIAPGSSGSALVYEGKIIGVIVMGTPRFQHLAISIHLEDVIDAVKLARELWVR